MYRIDEIRHLHMEVSSLCNARCPMCLRNVSGGQTNPQLPQTELRLSEVKSFFSETFLKQLKRIYFCGNYGDPILARDLIPILEFLRNLSPSLRLQVFTNGSLKEGAFWAHLAKLGVEIHFGIDGLADTHSLYRRNTDFEKILSNAKSFIEAGGSAHWDFILFRHNEHQVQEAESLSKQMGFRSFRAKKTGRFFSNRAGEVKTKQEVLKTDGSFDYYLEMPSGEHLNDSLKKEALLVEKYGSFENYLNQTPISCKVAEEKSLYISAEGLVFPCCWTALQLYPWYQKPESGQIWALLNASGGKSSVSLREKSLETILQGSFFQKIESSWGLESVSAGKLKVCSRICGKEFDPFRDQFKKDPLKVTSASSLSNGTD